MAVQTVRNRLLASSMFSGFLALGLVGGAAAAADKTDTSTSVDEVVVTGSRIPRVGFETLQPAQVVDSQVIQDRQFVNVAQAINELPSFGLPGAANQGNQSQYNVGQNFVNLYGLGSQRTLTLVNGRRFVSSNPPTLFGDASSGLQVDLNNIPVGLVDRIEVLSIGGAPIYGADAIAGTVNIILKDNFQGFQAETSYGQSQHSDARTYQVRALMGANLDEGRGNVTISAEYDKQEGLLYTDREFLRRGGSFQQTDDCHARGFGRCYIDHARVASLSYGGVPSNIDFLANYPGAGYPAGPGPFESPFPFAIKDANGTPLAFAPDGTLQPFNFGDVTNGLVFASGGDGVDLNQLTSLQAPIQRVLLNGFAHYDFTPHIRGYLETYFANSRATEQVNQPAYNSYLFGGTSHALHFSVDNPFLTQQARDTLLANGLTDFWLNRANRDIFPGTASNEVNVYRVVAGLKGDVDIGGRKLEWDGSYNFGHSQAVSNAFDIFDEAFTNALDAVRDPATGQIVCRVTLNPPPPDPSGRVNPAVEGCVPLNLFGEGAPSEAAKNFVTAPVNSISVLEQQDVQFNINFPLFDLPAGTFKVAGGFEYRKESGKFDVDGFSKLGLGRGAAITPLSGSFNSTEFYLETNIPVISPEMGIPLLHRAEIEASYRSIDNSRAGKDNVYTYGAKLWPVEDIELRGNVTHSARAPAIVELFLPQSTTFSFAQDPCDPQFITDNPTRQANCVAALTALGVDPSTFSSNVINATAQGTAGGNPNLRNEEAVSWTAGAVLRPRFIPGMTVALDWINIHLKDPITQLSLTQLLDGCYDSPDFPNNALCTQFTRDGGGQVVDFSTIATNVGRRNFSGLQIDGSYQVAVANLPMVHGTGDLGLLNFSVNAFWENEHFIDVLNNPNTIDQLKGEFGDPRWRVNASVRYTKGPWMGFFQARYVSDAAFNIEAQPTAQDIFKVQDYWTFNAAASYDINDNVTVQLSIDNLFDADPPRYADASGGVFQYDLIGRFYTVTMRARF